MADLVNKPAAISCNLSGPPGQVPVGSSMIPLCHSLNIPPTSLCSQNRGTHVKSTSIFRSFHVHHSWPFSSTFFEISHYRAVYNFPDRAFWGCETVAATATKEVIENRIGGMTHTYRQKSVEARCFMQIADVNSRESVMQARGDSCDAEVLHLGDIERKASHSTAEPAHHADGFLQQSDLPNGLVKQLLPRHVAIIMDGNSRWAQMKGLPASAGHEAGVRALKEVVKLSCKWGIQALTVFAFSTDNWHRPKVEVNFLMDLFEKVLREELANFVKENIRIGVIGDIMQLPVSLQGLIALAEKTTQRNTGLKLLVAVCYSGRDEIVRACQRVAVQVEKGKMKPNDITESMLDNELGTSWMGELRNPDLLIRTSGEQRLSNFLLWQLAYTELFFLDAFWPEFGESHYANALLSYQQRDRRFGRHSDIYDL